MALALYRKYRPRTFAEVIGQEHVTEPLSQALRSGRLNHAYLFSGPRGCGKTSSARILARSLNCEQGPTPEPCGVCDSCRSLASDGAGSIDVIEIDAASHGGVDDARELREKAFFAPASSRFKIYVIDEAHMVSSAGFNALLKLVEEPPEYVKFIFATTEPEKVLGTIKSRTHHYPFRLIPPGILRPYLEQLCAAEGATVDPAVFPLVVRAGGGSARDSLSVLDQLIAGAGPEGVTYARAVALLGVTDSALIDEMCDALAAGDGAAAYGAVDRVVDAGHDPRRFASDLLERLRDLIVLQQVPDAAEKGLVDGPADQIERMQAQAQQLGPGTLSRCADIVHNGLVEMRGATAPRLLLELVCARMLLPGVDDSTGGLLQRLERMERRLTLAGSEPPPAAPAAGGQPGPATPAGSPRGPAPAAGGNPDPATAGTAPVPTYEPVRPAAPDRPAEGPPTAVAVPVSAVARPSTGAPAGGPSSGVPVTQSAPTAVRREAVLPDPATPEPARTAGSAPGAVDAAGIRRVWPDVVGMVNRSNKRIAALMRDAVVRDLDGDVLVLTVKSSVLAQMLTNHASVLTDALYQELGGRWQVRCEVSGPGSRTATSARTAPAAAPAPTNRAAPAGAVERPVDDWPEPARPGGGVGSVTPAESGGDDWPEPARPGGAASAPSAASPAQASMGASTASAPAVGLAAGRPDAPAGSAPAPGVSSGPAVRPAASGGSAPVPAGSVAGNGGAVSSGLAAARAAAAGRAVRTETSRPAADSEFAGEPPYDPDYDGPLGRAAAPGAAVPTYEGFDPGDEPLDDVIDERTARQSSEQQAVQLLREALGAERIDEVEVR